MKPHVRPPDRQSEHALPQLEDIEAEQDPSESRAAFVLKLLRRIAVEYRSQRARPFYPVRAVARRFGISRATVSRLYQQLSAERLLCLNWGSKTLLEPIPRKRPKSRPQNIGLAVDLARFARGSEYQMTILAAQRELWNHRVTAQLLFFQRSADEVLHLLSRYHQGSIDTVLWIAPKSVGKRVLLAPRELGIRVVCIAPIQIEGIDECYTIPPGSTISKIVREQVLGSSGTGLLEVQNKVDDIPHVSFEQVGV